MDNEFVSRREIRRKKRKKRKVLFFGAILAIIVAGLGFFYLTSSPKEDGTVVKIQIEQGESAKSIAKDLKTQGLIVSEKVFLLDLKLSKNATKLRHGTYSIKKGWSNEEIIAYLCSDGKDESLIYVTIPEGYSLEMIVEKMQESGLSNKEDLLSAVNDDYEYDFLKSVPNTNKINYRLQGFLFPSTYSFNKDDSAHKIFDTMLKEFDKQIKNADIKTNDIFKLVTIASLVEREARLEEERARIAGVIYNRIDKNMRLQIDAAVEYAVTDGMYNADKVTYKNLKDDSPYNTYKNDGLPAGPICSPGIKSIIATENPEKHSYCFYRIDNSKNDGSHIFTETFEEHKDAK